MLRPARPLWRLSRTSTAFGLALGVAASLSACDGDSSEQPDAPTIEASPSVPGGAPTATGAPDPVPATGAPAATAKAEAEAAGAGAGTQPAEAAASLEGIAGLNLEGSTPGQRARAASLLETESSACGKAHSLLTSLREDPSCRDSLLLAQFIVDQTRKGIRPLDLASMVGERRKELEPKMIVTEGRPIYGNPRAPVTLVVFADFQCPHCAAEAPKLQAAVDAAKGRARLVFMHFPLNNHAMGRRAAMATEAAFAQKPEAFWALHNAVFTKQATTFDDPDAVEAKLRGYAKSVGLDLARFDEFMKFDRGAEAIEAGKKMGDQLGITGTPAVYVNGRTYSPYFFGGDLGGWIEDAANRPAG